MMAFISQTYAAVSMSCETTAMTSAVVANDGFEMDHSQHMGMSQPTDENSSTFVECCADCDCSLGGCNAAVLIGTHIAFAPPSNLLANHYSDHTVDKLIIPLYRPPISC